MKKKHRLLSAVLALALAASLPMAGGTALAVEGRAQGTATGRIGVTLRLDYAQKLSAVTARGVSMRLMQGETELGTASFGAETPQTIGAYPVSTAARSGDGGELGGSEWPGYLDLTVSDLPAGTYRLELSGQGYVSCAQEVELEEYSQQVILGTGDVFRLGDVNSDGKIDQLDRTEVARAIGLATDDTLARCDLNGDGAVDVTDLAYVGRSLLSSGEAEVLSTALMAPAVDTTALEQTLNVQSGDVADMFQDNGQSVTLAADDTGKVEIPVVLTKAPEVSQIEVVTPDTDGAIRKGAATVITEDDQTITVPFDNSIPEGIHAIGREVGKNIVTIDLGKRVAVKKITITVTKTEGGDYAVVENIRFLQDIVPENPVAANEKVKTVAAAQGDKQVVLKWSELPNVTGYKVLYGLKDGAGAQRQELHVDVAAAAVTGLENLKTYTFTVTPTNGDWEGTESEPVDATPQPASAPSAPDMLSVKELDGSLVFSWQKAKSATYYEVYMSTEEKGSFTQVGGALTGTSLTIGDLVNDQDYYLYVRAGNDIGKSGPSLTIKGTPQAVSYTEPEGIPTEGRISRDRIESVTLTDNGNWSSKVPADQRSAANMMDGSYRTAWTSQSYGDGNWGRSKQVNVTFKEPVDLANVVWVPRLDGGYAANLKAYTITVWAEGAVEGTVVAPAVDGGKTPAVTTWWGVKNSPAVTKFAVLPFAPVQGVKRMSITLDQQAYTAISLSELIFLEYDPTKALDSKINALFADELHTQLTVGVTAEQIAALKARLESSEQNYYLNVKTMADELALAAELLAGQNAGVVIHGIDARSSAADAGKYGQGGSDLQPLGVAATANSEITIYATGIPQGETVTVWATQAYAEAASWQARVGTLENGRNILTVPKIGSINTPRGGSLYLTYSGSKGGDISLHVRRAADVPVLELSHWYELDDAARRAVIAGYVDELQTYYATMPTNSSRQTNCLNVTEVSMPSVLLSLPATAVWDGVKNDPVESLYQNVLAWEDVMHITKTTQGIDSTYAENDMTSRQNIRYMRMFAGAFMYAAGSHVGVGYGSCGGLVNGKPITAGTLAEGKNHLFGWGVAHEIGHNMDKLGKAECTNNIYSLMVQTYDGAANTLPSRLEGGKYGEIFTKTAQGYPGASGNVFVQLGLYWQLHLAYDEAAEPMAFYNAFFKAWKAGTYTAGAQNYDEKVALTAAGVADKNLNEYFTRWGMRLSEGVERTIGEYPAESRAIWYLNDQSRRDRLAGGEAAGGSLSVAAGKQGDTEVLLTITPDISGSVQGYEILRNGKSIGFTTETTYTDVIGSANHMTFTYTVRAYDTLGNAVCEGDSEELRVAYDKTVDPDEYELVRDAETGNVTVTFTEETAISGLKLVGAHVPAAGRYTVTASCADGEHVTAKEGDFSKNEAVDDLGSYLAYFNKPGADAADTRIWTYDAKTVVITGIPAEVAEADIRLISYAGDDVAFYADAAVGELSADYRYGEGTDDVVKAGTLVVTGTYRGDPVFNTLRVKGRFTTQTAGQDGEITTGEAEERYLDGYVLLFAEIPDDGAVSDISDGFFIFVPDVQHEQALQGAGSHCTGASLLPDSMRLELYRTDTPNSAEESYLTASTLWLLTPGGDELPAIELKGE